MGDSQPTEGCRARSRPFRYAPASGRIPGERRRKRPAGFMAMSCPAGWSITGPKRSASTTQSIPRSAVDARLASGAGVLRVPDRPPRGFAIRDGRQS